MKYTSEAMYSLCGCVEFNGNKQESNVMQRINTQSKWSFAGNSKCRRHKLASIHDYVL